MTCLFGKGDTNLNTKFASFRLLNNTSGQTSSRTRLSRCVHGPWKKACNISADRKMLRLLILEWAPSLRKSFAEWRVEAFHVKRISCLKSLLEKLWFGTARISNYADIYVTAEIDALVGLFVHTSEEHQQNRTLDILMTENSWWNALDKPFIYLRKFTHPLHFLHLVLLRSSRTTGEHLSCELWVYPSVSHIEPAVNYQSIAEIMMSWPQV